MYLHYLVLGQFNVSEKYINFFFSLREVDHEACFRILNDELEDYNNTLEALDGKRNEEVAYTLKQV